MNTNKIMETFTKMLSNVEDELPVDEERISDCCSALFTHPVGLIVILVVNVLNMQE